MLDNDATDPIIKDDVDEFESVSKKGKEGGKEGKQNNNVNNVNEDDFGAFVDNTNDSKVIIHGDTDEEELDARTGMYIRQTNKHIYIHTCNINTTYKHTSTT